MTLEERIVRSGRWFYIIAGLTFLYAVVTPLGFITGSGIVGYLNASSFGPLAGLASAIHFMFTVVVVGGYVVFGYSAVRGYTWAFIAGVAAYACDTLLYLLVIKLMLATGSDLYRYAASLWYFPLLVHLAILWQIVPGIGASLSRASNIADTHSLEVQHKLRRAIEDEAAAAPPPPAAVFQYRRPRP